MNFYLVSTELRHQYQPRSCMIIGRLHTAIRDDLALVAIITSIPHDVYNNEHDLDEVILASRFEKTSLFPITEWPTYVYICRLKGNAYPNNDNVDGIDLLIMDWGAIHLNAPKIPEDTF